MDDFLIRWDRRPYEVPVDLKLEEVRRMIKGLEKERQKIANAIAVHLVIMVMFLFAQLALFLLSG